MKLGDVASDIVVDPRKLTEYALNPDSPRGRHKAHVFERVLGYTRENYRALLTEIEAKAPHANVELQSEDAFGQRYRADLQIEGPGGPASHGPNRLARARRERRGAFGYTMG